nr:reverse transcriptase domain-containing protein [Tanacetum cinerariifolium]
ETTPPHIPNIIATERPPVTTIVFVATTPENTSFAYRASTLTDPAPMISPVFVEANYEILKSLLRDRRRQIHNEDLQIELEYFSEDYDEELEMKIRPERTREFTPPLRTRSPRGNGPSEARAEENERQEMNLPLLLAAHLGRNEYGQPLRSSLTFVHGGHQSSINTGGNLPPNGTLLSYHVQPFIPNSVPVPNRFVPTHITPYSQPSAGIINGQTPSFLFLAQTGNPSVGGASAYSPQRGYIPQTFPNSNIPLYNGSTYPVPALMNNYPLHTQPMYAQPNMPVYLNPYPTGLFADLTGSVTLIVRWIKDYPLLDGLKMPSHVGSYDEKGDLDNLFHLFEGVILHNIKQIEGESVRSFATRYTDDTLQILGLDEDQRIFVFVHGLKVRNLVEHLFTNLPSTYKGLMERTYTWIECRKLKHQIEEAVKSGRLAHLVKGIKKKKEKVCDTQLGEWKEERKKAKPVETHVLMISRKSCNPRKRYAEEDYNKVGEITFPLVTKDKSLTDPVIIKSYVSMRQVNRPSIRSLRVDSKTPLVGLFGEYSWPLGEVPLEITVGEGLLTVTKMLNFIIVRSDLPHNLLLGRTAMQQMGIVVSTIHEAIKFHTPKGIGTLLLENSLQGPEKEQKIASEARQVDKEDILSCVDAKEKIVILARPKKSRRIAKWVIELGEHEIEFKGRNSIKGHILIDFLAETPPKKDKEIKNREAKRKEPESKNAWKLLTDEASSSDGSRAGLMLVDPKGKEYTYALRFKFETTNNEAEYEALLAGLRIAKEMKIQELIIFIDSQRVVNQVNGLFEARQPVIKQYFEKAKELLVSFPTYSIEHIKRDQNKKVDVLSKKATSQDPIIQANGWNVVPKIILITMVKVRRSSTGQRHHPRGTPRIIWNVLEIKIGSVKDDKAGILLAINA